MPRVSVCIPTYNHAEFVEATILSVLRQSENDIEVVVLDDQSTDDTFSRCAAISDSRLTVYRNPERLGLAANFNACLRRANARYGMVLCDDDLLEPNCLETLANALDTFSNCVLATSSRILLKKDGRRIVYSPLGREDKVFKSSEIVKASRLYINVIGEPSAVLIRTESLRGRSFNEKLGQLVDFDFWLRLSSSGDVAYIAAPLTTYRHHPAAQSSRNRRLAVAASDLLVMDSLYDDPDWTYPTIEPIRRIMIRVLVALRSVQGMLAACILRDSEALAECYRIFRRSFGRPPLK